MIEKPFRPLRQLTVHLCLYDVFSQQFLSEYEFEDLSNLFTFILIPIGYLCHPRIYANVEKILEI